MAEERFMVGTMFRAYLNAAMRMGLRSTIIEASPELAAMVEKLPLPTARIPGALCNKLYQHIAMKHGRSTVRRLGRESMREDGMKLAGSLVRNAFIFHGRNPEAIFKELPMILATGVANVEVAWKSESPRSGWVEIRFPQPAPLAHALYEGFLELFLEICDTAGVVEEAVMTEDQRCGSIRVSW